MFQVCGEGVNCKTCFSLGVYETKRLQPGRCSDNETTTLIKTAIPLAPILPFSHSHSPTLIQGIHMLCWLTGNAMAPTGCNAQVQRAHAPMLHIIHGACRCTWCGCCGLCCMLRNGIDAIGMLWMLQDDRDAVDGWML